TLYEAKDGSHTMYFAFGRPDTVLLSSGEQFVTQALDGTAKRALDNKELATWIGYADQKAPLWAAGRVDPRVREGVVKVMGGNVSAGPSAMVVSFDPTDGAKLEMEAVMANANDAKALESFAKTQLGLVAMAAQGKSLGTVVDKLAISSDGNLVR